MSPLRRRGRSAGAGEELDPDLRADVEATTRQAAIDGLPLAEVFHDLRMVLDLEPGQDLPADVLRVAALAWAGTQRSLSGPGPYDGVPCGTPDDLESHLWSSAGAGLDGPTVALVVRASAPEHGGGALALREVDLLVAAARSLAAVYAGPQEYVGLVRRPGAAEPDRAVALAVEADRVEEATAQVVALPPPGGPTLTVTVHDLRAHPESALGALRALRAALA